MIERMAQLFRQACSKIDQRAESAQQQTMGEAFQRLARGDEAGRDRMLKKCEGIPEVARRAKVEAWIRIGEWFGLSREECEATAEQMLNKARPN